MWRPYIEDVETIIVSEEDMVSYNVTTREIKFKDMEKRLPEIP